MDDRQDKNEHCYQVAGKHTRNYKKALLSAGVHEETHKDVTSIPKVR